MPFQMWAPDLYEGSPLVITALIAIVPKIAVLQIIGFICSCHLPVIYLIFFCTALWSVAVGAIGAFHQNNLARWLAYGSTGHMGVIIGCFISFDFAGIAASIISFFVGFLNLPLCYSLFCQPASLPSRRIGRVNQLLRAAECALIFALIFAW